jgi:hypothetical protein
MDYTAPMLGPDGFRQDSHNLLDPALQLRGGGRTQDAFGATLCRLPGRYAGVKAGGGVLYSTPGSPPLATPPDAFRATSGRPDAALGLGGPSSYAYCESARQGEMRTPPSEARPEALALGLGPLLCLEAAEIGL